VAHDMGWPNHPRGSAFPKGQNPILHFFLFLWL
jgi:hypothetical protein